MPREDAMNGASPDQTLRRSGTLFISVASLALLSRLALAIWPIQAAHSSQAAILQWPVFLVILLLGFPSMHFAHRWAAVRVVEHPLSPGFLQALGLGLAWALLNVAWDILFVLPRDINVIGPIAVPYYFTGAFLVEVLLHLLPLVLWLGLVGRLLFRGRSDAAVFWIAAVLIAAIEPLTQLGGDVFAGYSTAFFLVSAIIIYGANLVQLFLFRYGGFMPMLVFRVGLYFLWHIVWGPIRLQVLF